jgi:hypothetical protein
MEYSLLLMAHNMKVHGIKIKDMDMEHSLLLMAQRLKLHGTCEIVLGAFNFSLLRIQERI